MRLKKNITAITMFICLGMSSIVFAGSYENAHAFTNVTLPHGSANTTFKSGTKTTGRTYGKVQITSIGGGSKGVNVWLRSKKSNGEWDVLNSKLQSFTKAGTKDVYYTNSKTGYKIPYSKGTKAQLRGENKTNTSIVKDHVSGVVWFN